MSKSTKDDIPKTEKWDANATRYAIDDAIRKLYTWFIERGIFLVAVDKSADNPKKKLLWIFSSSMKRFDHKYTLEIKCKSAGVSNRGKLTKSVASWIYEDGQISLSHLLDDEQDVVEIDCSTADENLSKCVSLSEEGSRFLEERARCDFKRMILIAKKLKRLCRKEKIQWKDCSVAFEKIFLSKILKSACTAQTCDKETKKKKYALESILNEPIDKKIQEGTCLNDSSYVIGEEGMSNIETEELLHQDMNFDQLTEETRELVVELLDGCVSKDETKRFEALRMIQTHVGLQPALSFFIIFYLEGINCSLLCKDLRHITCMLQMLSALLLNPAIRLWKYTPKLLPSLLSCAVNMIFDVKCGDDRAWLVRERAADIIGDLLNYFERMAVDDGEDELKINFIRHLTTIWNDEQTTIPSAYGVLCILRKLGNLVIANAVIPNLRKFDLKLNYLLQHGNEDEEYQVNYVRKFIKDMLKNYVQSAVLTDDVKRNLEKHFKHYLDSAQLKFYGRSSYQKRYNRWEFLLLNNSTSMDSKLKKFDNPKTAGVKPECSVPPPASATVPMFDLTTRSINGVDTDEQKYCRSVQLGQDFDSRRMPGVSAADFVAQPSNSDMFTTSGNGKQFWPANVALNTQHLSYVARNIKLTLAGVKRQLKPEAVENDMLSSDSDDDVFAKSCGAKSTKRHVDSEFENYISVQEDPNGGASVLVSDYDQLRGFCEEEMAHFAKWFLKRVYEEVNGVAVHVMGIIHNGASFLPEILQYFEETWPDMPVKVGSLTNRQSVETMSMREYAENVYQSYSCGTFRFGPLMSVTLVDTKREEAGGYTAEFLDLLERSSFLKPVLPWGSMSTLSDMPRRCSEDGPIMWIRPGEQIVPTNAAVRDHICQRVE
ncbi:Round spermatid basic protein 1-like protein [Trichinella pseudospiralis]|uniref:Signal peptidase complex subunit 2 n=1 Tax=Trichinella pseudospiralis TaxID=6337 RepID=A0A0V0Y8S7_TRIPS|nr:Round spermatid basic protein 1-like protein [Trichinella pseudospiralis]KRX96583.1 Round spermatid basic protein 1-like protein [Trichinella pseudospiralis]